MTRWTPFGLALTLAAFSLGCGEASVVDSSTGATTGKGGPHGAKADSSIDAVFVDFEWDGEVIADSAWNPQKRVESQLLFTIGQLNGEHALGRLDKVVLTDVNQTPNGDGVRITYHATMPVAWGAQDNVPETYTLLLPQDIGYTAQERFTEAYSHACVASGAHDVDTGSMWYYYRPHRSGCSVADTDVFAMEAKVSISTSNTTGKYPEYHEVWKDDALEAVVIFGKFESGATESWDAGISAYNEFVRTLKAQLKDFDVQTLPADVSDHPGVDAPDVTITATLPGGRSIKVVVLLVDGVQVAGPSFDARYEALTPTADFIAYNGHAGLGANIRALARKGAWMQGQYAIVFMNGCDTFAYVDSELADAHASINADDPHGTKYLDILTNALPAPASQSPRNSLAIIQGLLSWDAPLTFEAIFEKFNRSQMVLVSGEQDNVYYPGYGETEAPGEWAGMDESGSVAADQEVHFETPLLSAGSYTFDLAGSGDADLYVRAGEAPTLDLWDCRPYRAGSEESCTLELSAPAAVHIMVRGYDPQSDFTLIGR